MKYVLGLAALAVLVLAGCGGASEVPPASPAASPTLTAAQLAAQYDLHPRGAPQAQSRALPAKLSNLPWALYQHASRAAGFDLRPYRSQQVDFSAHPLRETLHGSPATLWTVEHGADIVGAYVTVEGEAPGIYSLQQAKAEL